MGSLPDMLLHACVLKLSLAGSNKHRRTGTFGLGGAVTFLPEKIYEFPDA